MHPRCCDPETGVSGGLRDSQPRRSCKAVVRDMSWAAVCHNEHRNVAVPPKLLPPADAGGTCSPAGRGDCRGRRQGRLRRPASRPRMRQLADISTIDEAEFVGVAESIEGLVEEAKKVQPNAHYASDYRQFVKDQKPQIVWAFVENNRHLEIVEFLAPLGVHVIFEKPLPASTPMLSRSRIWRPSTASR